MFVQTLNFEIYGAGLLSSTTVAMYLFHLCAITYEWVRGSGYVIWGKDGGRIG